ncbi:hypothetical protein [Paraburkholderia tropica]|uniref:hypothetical protein n=1 Tax=Paraburkholderia tropica TaxID=92647 RepID=UPI002AAFD905|nr:hypothetical protein [Paraburkholderia tropica]
MADAHDHGTNTGAILRSVLGATDLRKVQEILTAEMAQQKIQALIKGANLDRVCDRIYDLAERGDQETRLAAAAVLGRLAAVARSRESQVFGRLPQMLAAEPPTLDTLKGDERTYAAQSLRYARGDWLAGYCIRESLALDTAENARKELLFTALTCYDSVSATLAALASRASSLNVIENPETKYRRVRRVFNGLSDALREWQGAVGEAPGLAVSECLKVFLRGNADAAGSQAAFSLLEGVFTVLARIIEMRFSHALHAEMYVAIEQGKKAIGGVAWSEYVGQSEAIVRLRVDMLEAALVIARQNRTDVQIMAALAAAYGSRAQVGVAVKRHFKEAHDLDPDVREWWASGGEITSSRRKVEHKVGNTEDQQIGALLVEVESNKDAMDKLGRAVVPFLEIYDAVLASTVKRAASGYLDMAQIARRLARMRKLTTTNLRGERLEYNPLEHEMLGGHRPGVRRVKVVRDGVQKEFGGKVKTLVKPWVEPEE